jgi:hypothetical protein
LIRRKPQVTLMAAAANSMGLITLTLKYRVGATC